MRSIPIDHTERLTPARIILLVVLLVHTSSSWSQQLVPNAGFEELITCPDFQSQLDRTTHWTSPSVQGTPDYYHACASNPLYGVPQNTVGVQLPVEGDAYVGFFLFIAQPVMAEWREYIQVPLIAPLETGRCYRLRLHAALAEFSLLTTWSLGARFRNGAYALPDPFIPGDTAHITLPENAFLDHTEWTVLEGEYIAAGGEDHLMIGNFLDDEGTPTQSVSSTLLNAGPFIYVLVDAVSLVSCSALSTVGPDAMPDGVSITREGLQVTTSVWKGGHVRIHDTMGRVCLEQQMVSDRITWPEELRGAVIVELRAANGAVLRQRLVR
jgi:hypothetical protein